MVDKVELRPYVPVSYGDAAFMGAPLTPGQFLVASAWDNLADAWPYESESPPRWVEEMVADWSPEDIQAFAYESGGCWDAEEETGMYDGLVRWISEGFEGRGGGKSLDDVMLRAWAVTVGPR